VSSRSTSAGDSRLGQRRQRAQNIFFHSHPLPQWGHELFPPCFPKSLVVNGAIFPSICVPAKNIVKPVRDGQVIWAASLTRFGE